MVDEIRLSWHILIPYMEQIAAAAQYRAETAIESQITAESLVMVNATR